MTPHMSESEIERRKRHLLAEMTLIENRHKVPKKRYLYSSAVAAAILAICLVAALLQANSGNADIDNPELILVSSVKAVDSTTDVVLYAKETHFEGNDSSSPRVVSEAWSDRKTPGVGRVKTLDSDGKSVVDSSAVIEDGKTVRQDISYDTSTVHVSTDVGVEVKPLLPDQATKLVGEELIDNVESLHISGLNRDAPIEAWVNKVTRLPIRVASMTKGGLVVLDYQWFQRTEQTLATINVAVPENFIHSDEPLPSNKQPEIPGSDVASVVVPGSELNEATATIPNVAASPTTVVSASPPVVVIPSTTTTVASTAPPPAPVPYDHTSTGKGLSGRVCQSHFYDADSVYVVACVGIWRPYFRSENQTYSFTGVGDVSVYRVEGAKKWKTSKYLVKPSDISLTLANGSRYDTSCYCQPTLDYGSIDSAYVFEPPGEPHTASAQFHFEIYKSDDPNSIGTFTVETANPVIFSG